MTTPIKKVNDLYNLWYTGDGVFTDLNAYDVPWKLEDAGDNVSRIYALNHDYHGNISGDKWVSPLVRKLDENEVTTPRAKLASVIYTLYADKWTRLWETINAEYNPLNNYDMVENETPAEITHTITPAETTTTLTPPETTLETKPAKTVTENEVSAFNSSSYEDSDKTTITGDSNDKGSDVFSVDSSGTTKLEVDTAGSDALTVQNERTLTRSGNIGVTSSMQLINQEIELRRWNFFKSVFNDIDNVLTLSIY